MGIPRTMDKAAETGPVPHSIVGVVGDVKRDMDGHHYAEICSVFGINQEELETIQSHGLETKPKKYDLKKDRYQVFCSPWRIMRILGLNFGYKVPTMPMIGLVNTEINQASGFRPAGERRTCIFTLERK